MMKLIYRVGIALAIVASNIGVSLAVDNKLTHAIIDMPEVRVENPLSQIINTPEDWEIFFQTNTAIYNGGAGLVTPEFDFEKFTIIAGGLGSDYWYSEVMVRSVTITDSATYVSILILTPGQGCDGLQEITYPTIAILVPKPNGEFVFSVSELIADCE